MYTHPDYFPILYTLNLSPESQAEMFIEYRNWLLEIVDDMPESESLVAYIQGIKEIKGIQMILWQLWRQKLWEQEEDIRNLEQKLFEEIMYVAPEKKNVHNIYRIGTFLKYFISENNKRLLEDSLITTFSTYFYDEDFDTVVDRFKSLDIKYLLIDLNAATIDQDPRKQLTKRYEDLLMFATHPDVQLVETDSVCVKLALDEYNRDKDIEKYLQIAGINYGNWQEKGKKKMLCLSQIYELIKNEKINKENYSYLLRIQEYLFQTLKNAQDTGQEIDSTLTTQTLNRVVNHGYKALFEIK